MKIDPLLKYFIVIVSVAVTFGLSAASGGENIPSLDGAKEIEDSKQPEAVQPRGTIGRRCRASRTPRSQLSPRGRFDSRQTDTESRP
jgi:hypothetical protein